MSEDEPLTIAAEGVPFRFQSSTAETWLEHRGDGSVWCKWPDGRFVQVQLEEEYADACRIIRNQARLLTAAVERLRGPPPEDTLWSHHDVPQLVAEVVTERDHLRTLLKAAQRALKDMQAQRDRAREGKR